MALKVILVQLVPRAAAVVELRVQQVHKALLDLQVQLEQLVLGAKLELREVPEVKVRQELLAQLVRQMFM